MKHHFLFSIILLFCLSSCIKKPGTSPINPPPDKTKWGYDVGGGGWGNNELEYYTKSKTENARVEKGNLIIEARKESIGGRNYTSARLLTINKAQWTYGKFEVKAKIPKGRGLWPANGCFQQKTLCSGRMMENWI